MRLHEKIAGCLSLALMLSATPQMYAACGCHKKTHVRVTEHKERICGEPVSTCCEKVSVRSAEQPVRCKDPDIDFKKLRAANAPCSDDLIVHYKIEIGEPLPSERFELVLQARKSGSILYREVIPLENGVMDKDELVFQGDLTGKLPAPVQNRSNFILEAEVMRAGESVVLERERERIHRSDKEGGLAYQTVHFVTTPYRWTTATFGLND